MENQNQDDYIRQEEEKKQSQNEVQNDLDPVQELKDAFKLLSIDPSQPDFSEEKAVQIFLEKSLDKNLQYQEKEKYKHLAKILGKHAFWKDQPIVQPLQKMKKVGQIKQFNPSEISDEPLALPPGFIWSEFDSESEEQLEEFRQFLDGHYSESDDERFRLKYPSEKIKWVVHQPGYVKEFCFFVRNQKNNKILASFYVCPRKFVILGQTVKGLETNLLAVHKSLRGKRMAQIMISEGFRRTRKVGHQIAYYTSPHSIPTPFCTSFYMNRFINCEKLVDIGYCPMPQNTGIKDFIQMMKLHDKKKINIIGNIRQIEKKDISQVFKLYQNQHGKYKIYYKLSQDELYYYIMPRKDLVWTWVIENEVEGKKTVTDFFSMTKVNQTCLLSEAIAKGYETMSVGSLFYYGLQQNSLKDVIKQLLWIAKEEVGCDAFSVIDQNDNYQELFLKELKFYLGDGQQYHYLVNYSIGDAVISQNDIGPITL